jgi:5'-deoxynucleotidase YfbR-like HD superfamily hydrolase
MVRFFCGKLTPLDGSEMDHITLEGVGAQLAHINRWDGAAGRRSVAAHCLRVADYCTNEERLCGLMHDVGECITGDIGSTVKHLCPDLVSLEQDWTRRLCLHLLGPYGEDTADRIARKEYSDADQLDYQVQWAKIQEGAPYHPDDTYREGVAWVDAVLDELYRRNEEDAGGLAWMK